MDEQESLKKKETMEVQGKEKEIKYRGWKVMPFIIGNETFEKLGTIGTSSNLLVYLTTVFNMKAIEATTIVNIFQGTCNLFTLFGAFLTDTYFGRYRTLGFCTCVSFFGLLVIQLSAAIPQLHPPTCGKDSVSCTGPTPGQMAFLVAGFALLVVGAAGIRPCNLAFGADQFNPLTESGKRGINSFFNWYFFTFTFAQMVSVTLIVYVQSNISWTLGLGIPALLMLVACALFFVASNLYVKVPAAGSPITSVLQVFVSALRKRRLKQPDQPWVSLFNYISPDSINSNLPYTDQFRFVNKAAIRTGEDKLNPNGSASDGWKLCTMQQVEEVKCVMRVLPIWASNLFYHIIIVNQHTFAVFQALQSNRRLGSTKFMVPAASYYVFLMLSFSAFIPIYDRVLVPFLRRLTGKEEGITLLQRIGIGTVIAVAAMVVSGLVEERRRSIALTMPTLGHMPRKGDISAMPGLWLIPQLALAGLSETFASVGHTEFLYKQFPENMRSIAGSLYYCALAGSSYLSSFLISMVQRATRGEEWLPEDLNKGRLDLYYYMIGGLEVLNLAYFLVCAKWYKYKGTAPPMESEMASL